ncbi:MAG: hypothetical protein LKE81_07805 [Acetobacter sp.]|jgi:hypothetical protein|nr:hypothetical protein [Acetobacter sp.]MCH4061307.1 hypothetical protein [Acetobacter sp.]MCH4088244.1 hypothetical protein [Acetobacter sp.]
MTDNQDCVEKQVAANDNLTQEDVEKAAQVAVFAVANLIGRRMAREYFTSYRAANDNCSSSDNLQKIKERQEGDC